jgi:hypothetical protein
MKRAQGVEEISIKRYKNILEPLDTWKDIEKITKDDLSQILQPGIQGKS